GETVVVGAIKEDSITTGVNSTPNEVGGDSGAAYIFTGFVPVAAPEIVIEQPAGMNLIVGNASINFGPVNVGSSSVKTFTVKNTGTADLTLNSIASTSNQFVVDTTGTSPTVVAGSGTTFNVAFSPGGTGFQSGFLQIASNDSDESPFQVFLNGSAQTTPTVTTPTRGTVTATSATLGGNVTSDGTAAITERGVIYAATAINANPMVGGTGVTKITVSGTRGPFTTIVHGLSASTGYTFKAYATNGAGTGYSIADTFNTNAAAPGDLDIGFAAGGIVMTPIGSIADFGQGVAVQSDGEILVTGYSRNADTDYDIALLRYTASGALDNGFGTGGKVIVDLGRRDDRGQSVAVQSDGKILVAGYSRNANIKADIALLRYNPDGSLDSGFGTGGIVTTTIGPVYDYGFSVAVQSDGKIVVAGTSLNAAFDFDFALVRYNTDGSLDNGFGTGGIVTTPIGSGNDSGRSVALQSDGKILVAGDSRVGSNNDFALVRYNTDGSLDSSFGTGGIVTTLIGSIYDYGNSVAVQSDGKILVGGASSSGTNNYDFALARYMTDGTLDSSFGTGGIVTTPIGGDDFGQSVAVQSSGKILVAGYSRVGSAFALARYNSDGSLDNGFGTGGIVTTEFGQGYGMALQSDGNILVTGWGSADGHYAFALLRYNGGTSGDIDGDGLLDSWELAHWPTIAGHRALDDFDRDGYVELLELALGLNPTFPNAGGLPAAINEGGYLTMTITKQVGVTYEVQSAGTLLPALPDSFSAASTTVLINNATTLKVRDNILIGTPPARYLRLKVTAAP
ncbi:MAG: choice-of-anchor D domain-containing protein, partial [Chthoniobacteraceae bacterium]